MWRVTHRSRDRLAFLARESWFGQLFWSLFLGAGLASLGALVFIGIPKMIRNPPEVFWHYVAGLLPITVGGAFTWIGAWGVAGRLGVDIDRPANRVVEWSGYFRPIWHTAYDLKSFDQVMLEPPVRRGGVHTAHWEYPVAITGAAGARIVMEVRDPQDAEAFARDIADFLGLKLSREAYR